MSEELETQVKQYIEANGLIGAGDVVLAGVSGGADSMCLLELLRACREKIDFALHVIHVEHGIRGEASMADAQHVADYCKNREIPCEVVHVDACMYAAQHGYSLEEAARLLRYEAFERVAQALEQSGGLRGGQVRIAVAHHREDQAETVLWQMIRGSDLRGIGGIRPRRGRIIRPLLEVGRGQIEAYLTGRGVCWCEDATNADTAYTRNRLRQEVFPVLEQLNAQAVRHLCESAARLQEAEDYLAQQTQAVYEKAALERQSGEVLVLEQIRQEPPMMQRRVLYYALERCAGQAKDLQAKHIAALLELLDHQVGHRLSLPYGVEAWRDYKGVALTRRQQDEPDDIGGSMRGRVQMEIIDYAPEVEISKKKYTKCFDYDKIEHHVQIRKRQRGDYLTIDAAGHRQKLKSYLVNEKIPRQEREKLWLLADGSHIMWVIGHRVSDYYKVDTHTRRILKVQYSGGKENE